MHFGASCLVVGDSGVVQVPLPAEGQQEESSQCTLQQKPKRSKGSHTLLKHNDFRNLVEKRVTIVFDRVCEFSQQQGHTQEFFFVRTTLQ